MAFLEKRLNRPKFISHTKMWSKPLLLKFFLFVIVLWFIVMGIASIYPNVYSAQSNRFLPSSGGALESVADNEELVRRLDQAFKEFQILKDNNIEMKKIIAYYLSKSKNDDGTIDHEHRNKNSNEVAVELLAPELLATLNNNENLNSIHQNSLEPSIEYERTRRLLEIDLKEFWYNVRSKKVNIGDADMKQIEDVYRHLRAHLVKLRNSDGYESYREKETNAIAKTIRDRILQLQNPKDCNSSKKLVCTLNKGCGFGCQVHHVCYCLIVAYATSRTLILESKGWRYNRKGWDNVFLPLSDTCTNQYGKSKGDWSTAREDVQVLQLPIVDFLKPRPPYLPVAIPLDLGERLENIHGEPHIWWVGQFMTYLLRLQPQTQKLIDEAKEKMGFTSPIVGIHVRRTDKIGTEASFHPLKEYMEHAEEYFNILNHVHGKEIQKRVFIASDDPNVITEATKRYTSEGWEILGDKGVAQSAAVSQRYNGLVGIIKDVFLLAECDLVVCTFSSQVCRLAYELIQARHADASQRFVSLDDVYYYGGGIGIHQVAIEAHEPRSNSEIELQVGDLIGVAGNHWNGMSKGTNRRTKKIGLYPSHKARYVYDKIDFPEEKWWLKSKSTS